jgi:putative nucleotidyltransferase with HDIG domain
MVVLMVFIASITARFDEISFYIIPFTILPILLRTFYDERIAVFIHVITILVIGFIAPNSYEFVFLTITAGIVAIFSLTNLYRRSRFFLSAFLVVITYCIAYFGISVVQEGSFSQIEWKNFGYFGINGVLILISFQLIYVFEKTFGFLSDTTLMELSDTNQPLLRSLAEIAPGTFQHSLQVANLSEEAIYRIGGNPLLIRTGALYHDIGKMYNPVYFIENQTKGINPHDNLEFEESARIIIGHVSEGVELAKKNKLPKAIIDFIRTHHGTSTVQYFYRSYIKKYPEKDVDLTEFSYPGPKPISKEMAVFMMADSVEAASRSMQEYSQESISALVEKIITIQLNGGQFEEATITFRDIKKVKEVFNIRLRNIYHARISYPK